MPKLNAFQVLEDQFLKVYYNIHKANGLKHAPAHTKFKIPLLHVKIISHWHSDFFFPIALFHYFVLLKCRAINKVHGIEQSDFGRSSLHSDFSNHY